MFPAFSTHLWVILHSQHLAFCWHAFKPLLKGILGIFTNVWAPSHGCPNHCHLTSTLMRLSATLLSRLMLNLRIENVKFKEDRERGHDWIQAWRVRDRRAVLLLYVYHCILPDGLVVKNTCDSSYWGLVTWHYVDAKPNASCISWWNVVRCVKLKIAWSMDSDCRKSELLVNT